ncbi:MAG: hypothetical protein ACE5MB_04815 [Anaerolineae bacterium]
MPSTEVGQRQARPIRVEFVGLLPTLFNFCAPCCTTDHMKKCGVDYISDQMADYPPEALAVQERAAELYAKLMSDFGDRILPVAVGLTTLRGLLLSLRHRLGNDLAIVINGRRVISGQADYETLKRVIREEMTALNPDALW